MKKILFAALLLLLLPSISIAGPTIQNENLGAIAVSPDPTLKQGVIEIDSTAYQLVTKSGVSELVLGGVSQFVTINISGVTEMNDASDTLGPQMPYNVYLMDIEAAVLRNGGANHQGTTVTIMPQVCSGPGVGGSVCSNLLGSNWVLSGGTNAVLSKGLTPSQYPITQNWHFKVNVISGATNSNLMVQFNYWIRRN